MQTQTPAEILKQSTALLHAGTEKALVQHIKGIGNTVDYARLLHCLYGFYQPLEKVFDTHLSHQIPDYTHRRKSGRILDDIMVLGYAAPERFATVLPSVSNAVSALGCYYVLEGSVLGGAVIKKLILAKCPQVPEQAFSFLSGYGDTWELWQSFLTHLNAVLKPDDLSTAIAAANDCFTQFEKWIKAYYEAKTTV
jgi:Heme oxygenase